MCMYVCIYIYKYIYIYMYIHMIKNLRWIQIDEYIYIYIMYEPLPRLRDDCAHITIVFTYCCWTGVLAVESDSASEWRRYWSSTPECHGLFRKFTGLCTLVAQQFRYLRHEASTVLHFCVAAPTDSLFESAAKWFRALLVNHDHCSLIWTVIQWGLILFNDGEWLSLVVTMNDH